MELIEFKNFLTDEDFVRVSFRIERGKIQEFVIQLECLLGDTWHPIVRYDTAHGFAHRDLLHPKRDTEKTSLEVTDFNEALTFAQNDLRQHWQKYREQYSIWLAK